MSEHYDELETRDPGQRETALMAALPAQLAACQATAGRRRAAGRHRRGSRDQPRCVGRVAGHPQTRTAGAATGRARRRRRSLRWPLRHRLAHARCLAHGAARVPVARPDLRTRRARARDYWRFGRALFAAGFRGGDLVHNSFSYHLTPAGSMMETGAHAIGCAVFAGGVGNTELQLQAMRELRPDAYAGTPSFLRIALEKADELGIALPFLRKASVGGEAFPPALRDALAARGIQAYQSYGTADLGLIAYETEARQGLVLDEDVIVEIVRPGTGQPVPEGEVGEVVVTTLNADYPLVRFGTGDLSAVLPGTCPTGRTAPRIKGWLGRADQTAKVRGMFVHPGLVAAVLGRHPEVRRGRLVIEGEMANDRMTLHAECDGAPEGLAAALAGSLRDVTKLRGEVVLAPPGSLPNDGKVIEDARRLQ